MTAANCLFCRIVAGEIPAAKIYETDAAIAFRDLNPQAPTHVLVIPRAHIAALSDGLQHEPELLGKLLHAAANVAAQENLNASGYRVVINNGADAGQTVNHLHLHVLGGRSLAWPPG